MKLLTVFILLFGLNAFAENCEDYGGQTRKITITQPQPAVLTFCYFGSAGMELKTLINSRFNPFAGPDANQAYRQTRTHDFMACSKFSGREYRGKDEQGFNVRICAFWDRSAIDNNTLTEGFTSPWNQQFNTVLGIF